MFNRARRIGIAVTLTAGLSVVAASGPLFAQPIVTATDALEAWVAEIDAMPELDAEYESLTGAGGNAVLTGLTITGSELIMTFDPISVTGYRALPPTGYAFESLTVARVQARTPTSEVNIVDLAIDNLTLPESGFAYDEKRPISSALEMFALLQAASIDRLAFGRIDIGQFQGGLDAVVSYHNYVLTGIADGRIEAATAGPLVMQAPVEEGKELFHITVNRLEYENIDFGALARVFDPAAYEDGDRDWRPVFDYVLYENILVEAPDLQMRIRALEIDDFQMRLAAEPITPILEALMTNTELTSREADAIMQELIVDLISPYGLGEISVRGLDIFADEIDRMHLGEFHITELSLDGLGEIGFSDLDIIISGEGYLRMGSFAFGGIELADEETLREILAAIAEGAEPDILAEFFVQAIGYIEVADFAFGEAGNLPVTLDRFLIASDGYVGLLPSETELELRGLNVPLTIVDGEVRQMVNRLGFTEFLINLGIYAEWDEASSTMLIDGAYLAVEGAGEIRFDMEIGGVTRELLEDPEGGDEEQLARLTIIGAEIYVRDESVADRLFRMTAEGNDIPAEQYRREFIAGLPVILGLTIDRSIALEISPALQQFLREPSELVLTLRPEEPVLLGDVMLAVESTPFALLDMLGVTLEVTPLN